MKEAMDNFVEGLFKIAGMRLRALVKDAIRDMIKENGPGRAIRSSKPSPPERPRLPGRSRSSRRSSKSSTSTPCVEMREGPSGVWTAERSSGGSPGYER